METLLFGRGSNGLIESAPGKKEENSFPEITLLYYLLRTFNSYNSYPTARKISFSFTNPA